MSDMKKSIEILRQIERIWPGASRSRSILERLLHSPRAHSQNTQFPSLPLFEGLLWEQFPDTYPFMDQILED